MKADNSWALTMRLSDAAPITTQSRTVCRFIHFAFGV
jgi:hypothetical protein